MAVNGVQVIVDLLINNWNDANTDNHTPLIDKNINYKDYNFNINKDLLLVNRPINNRLSAAVGPIAKKNLIENYTIDLRTYGVDEEDHFFKVVEEIKRIIQANKIMVTVTSGEYDTIETNGQAQDKSDEGHNMYRIIIPCILAKYNVNR